MIKHGRPATWNPTELVSGAREPIYNLNCIIWLQMNHALDLLAEQARKMWTVIFQHCMVLDYLLAVEGEVCGK